MKKVFSVLAVAAAMLVCGTASAQGALGVHVGYAPQSYRTDRTSGNTTYHDTLSMNGFFAGVDYNLPVSGGLNVNVGLQVRYNTFSDSTQGGINLFGLNLGSGKVKRTDQQLVVDVPIMFNYGFNLSGGLKMSVFAGPTISYALSGSTKVEGSGSILGIGGGSETTRNWYNADEGNMRALDLSGTLGVNFTYGAYRLFGGYNMGLLNTSAADNTTRKGANWFVGLGYAL